MALRESPADPKVAALRESRCLNPHPRAGHRPGFPGRGVLRPPGRGAGQVRDGAPRQRGRRTGDRDSGGVRVLPAVVRPGSDA